MATFMGGGVGGNWPGYMYLRTVATINSQDVANNKSNVTIKAWGYYEGSNYPPNPTIGSQYIKINDVTKHSASFNTDFTGTSSTNQLLLMTWTGDLQHNADGSLTVNIKVYQNCPDVTTLDYLWGNHTWTLTTIPRASQPSLSAGSMNIGSGAGNSVTIYTNRADAAMLHSFDYSIGSKNATFATNVADSTTLTLPETIAEEIRNGTSGVVVITCYTWVGGVHIGTKTVSLTVYVPYTAQFWPTVSIDSITEGAAGLSGFSVFIQGKSRLSVSSSAATKHYAAIAQIRVEIDGANYYGSPVTSGVINKSGTVTVKVVVTDSRGYTAETTFNTTFQAYAVPQIIGFSAARSPNDQGTDLSAPVNFSVSSVSGQNGKRYLLRYRPVGGSWTNIIDSYAYYARSITHTAAGVLNGNSSYEVELYVADSFTSVSKIITIGTAFELINYRSTGKGIAFGKVSEYDGLEFALPIFGGIQGKIGNVNTFENWGTFYGAGQTNTGAIIISIGTTNMMINAKITLRSYAMLAEINVGGYTYTATGGWHLPQATGNAYGGTLNVRFVSNGVNRYIVIGETTTAWSGYLHVTVDKLAAGYYDGSTPLMPFAITLSALLPGNVDSTISVGGMPSHTHDNLTTGGSSNKSITPYGYIEFGPMNGGYAHIYTDRPSFYFNKELYVGGSLVRTRTTYGGDVYNGYEVFNDGTRHVWKTLNTNYTGMNTTSTTGLYRSNWIALGNWALGFNSLGRVKATLTFGGTEWGWMGAYHYYSVNSAGEFQFYKTASSDSNVIIFIDAWGT